MGIKISLLKDNTNIEPDFYEIYTLDKQNKTYSKKPLMNIVNEFRVQLHADSLVARNTLPGI